MILLDTHALIWWLDGDNQRLSPRALEAIAQELGQVERGEPKARLLVSAISCWEVAMLVAQARALALPLLSANSRIQSYPHVRCLW